MKYQQSNISENNFEQCTKCTICTVYCPMLEVNPLYPGPKQAGPDGERYRLREPMYYDEALRYCLNCKRCEMSCPSGVRIGDIITLARIKNSKARRAPLRDRLLAQTDMLGSVASYVAPVVNSTLSSRWFRKALDGVLSIDQRSSLPNYTGERFTTWYRKEEQAAKQSAYPRRLAYFYGCWVNYHNPDLGRAMIEVFNAVGCGLVLMDDVRCCGREKISSGMLRSAQSDAKANLEQFRKAVGEGGAVKVVATSPACIYTLRESYHNILGLDVADLKERLTLATRFLYRLMERGEIRFAFREDYHRRVAYHSACYMERLGWTLYSTSLLRLIPGLELLMLPSQCCGRAGSYALRSENYSFSEAIGGSLFGAIESMDIDCVVTDCESCREQIASHTSARVLHPIEILAEALDLPKTRELNGMKEVE